MVSNKEPKDIHRTYSLMFEMGQLIRNRMRATSGPTMPQMEVLQFVGRARCTMHALAHHMRISAPSATSLVNELVNDGLITRNTATEDRRRVELTLTPRGATTLEKGIAIKKKIFSEIVRPLSTAERKEFNRLLEKITNQK